MGNKQQQCRERQRNYLNRVRAVQRVYREHKHEGVTDVHIWKAYIQPVYYISERTFRAYLTVRAGALLRDLESPQPPKGGEC
jgi:hypothetical protein